MKTENKRSYKDSVRKTSSEYQKSMKQNNSNFMQSQLLYTPQHNPLNLEYHDMLSYTKQSLKTCISLTCANKLCEYYSTQFLQSPNSNNNKSTNKIVVQQITQDNLCPKCQQQFRNQSYCIYCKQIYFDSTDDGKEWIMCEECERWLHSQCADFNTKDNPNAVFKCIKCKCKQIKQNYFMGQSQGLGLGRRNLLRTTLNVKDKKKNGTNSNQFLSSIGFQWELNTNQIAEDMHSIQQFLGTS